MRCPASRAHPGRHDARPRSIRLVDGSRAQDRLSLPRDRALRPRARPAAPLDATGTQRHLEARSIVLRTPEREARWTAPLGTRGLLPAWRYTDASVVHAAVHGSPRRRTQPGHQPALAAPPPRRPGRLLSRPARRSVLPPRPAARGNGSPARDRGRVRPRLGDRLNARLHPPDRDVAERLAPAKRPQRLNWTHRPDPASRRPGAPGCWSKVAASRSAYAPHLRRQGAAAPASNAPWRRKWIVCRSASALRMMNVCVASTSMKSAMPATRARATLTLPSSGPSR